MKCNGIDNTNDFRSKKLLTGSYTCCWCQTEVGSLTTIVVVIFGPPCRNFTSFAPINLTTRETLVPTDRSTGIPTLGSRALRFALIPKIES